MRNPVARGWLRIKGKQWPHCFEGVPSLRPSRLAAA
jgi:hypothetical protein